jgi:tol-pal system protein YbgF
LLTRWVATGGAPSWAPTPGQASAQRLSLVDRVTLLENQANVANQGAGQANLDAQNRIVQLQGEVSSLRNLVETLQHEINQLKQTNRQQYIDLDGRLGRLEGSPPRASATPSRDPAPAPAADPAPRAAPAAAGQGFTDAEPVDAYDDAVDPMPGSYDRADPMTASDPADEEADYQAALDTLVERFEAAESARLFKRFIAAYPGSPLLPNAYYWLGESYYVTQNYELALDAFRTLLGSYPGSRKEADALLKTGYSQIAVGDTGAGEATLRDLVSRFPGTEAAAKAQSRLRTLALENG